LSLVLFTGGIVALLYLGFVRGWTPLWLVVVGLFLTVFYSTPPFRLSYVGHGPGELAVGVGFGPVIVLGTYYVQVQRLSLEAL
jgi:1,4-dihydroxy-2-naphthoate octaprenyltransferase